MSLTLNLHVTCLLHSSILTASAMNSSLYRQIVTTTLSLLYRLGHQLALALSRAEVLRVTDYLQTNVFSDLVVVEREECPRALQRKAIKGATSKVVRETASRMWLGLTLGTSTSASTIHHSTWWIGVTAK